MKILDTYKTRFEKALESAIVNLGPDSRLRDACSYSLLSNGKRFRPILVLLIAEALGSQCVMPAALSVEFFHTASLIADDMPCMDNDSLRRGLPTLHLAFDQATALLASYTMIAAGYGYIYENSELLKKSQQYADSAESRAMSCLQAVSNNAGLKGATYGQYLDLFPPSRDLDTVIELIEKKTSSLFEIAFVFGWLFGGGDLSKISLVKTCAQHFGMSFQIADDLEDDKQDEMQGKGLNICSLLGQEKALELFLRETNFLKSRLKELHLWTQPFQEIYHLLISKSALVRSSSFL